MHLESFAKAFLSWSFIICFGYLLTMYAFIVFVLIAASFENLRRKSEAHADDYDALLDSRFTIPVSVIVPAYNEEGMICTVVRRLLDFDYPEFEVILVNDGSTDATLATLAREFGLEPIEMFYRKTLSSKPVRAIYRSRTNSRFLVVDKDNGGKADALNCGINLARYRYLCCVDGDSTYRREALLAAMRLAVKDPATVVGVTSFFAVGRHLDIEDQKEVGNKSVDRHIWTNLQHIEMLRAFVNSRLGWSRLGTMLSISGAFGIWRRDVVHEVGGFSSEFSCEDIEMTFRIYEKLRREGRPVKILALADMIGTTEGPEHVSALISQRARWQRVILETVWHYRRMLFNHRYGTVGFLGMPYFVLFECVAPFMQVLVVISLVAGAASGFMNWAQFLSLVGIQIFGMSILSSVGLGMHDTSYRYYRLSDLVRLILIAPLELLWYRPILAYAHAKGVVEFFRGDKGWLRFERNVHPT